MRDESSANNPQTAQSAVHFCELLFADVELAFSKFFGQRWTPEVRALYESALESCLAQARIVDHGIPKPPAPVDHPRVLTNYPDGR